MSQAHQDKQASLWILETGHFTRNTDFPHEGWRGCEGGRGSTALHAGGSGSRWQIGRAHV